MQKGFLSALKKILADRHRRKVWQRIVSGMMAVVVFCTTYALILPGITLERQTYCGLEEHTHTDECYAKDSGGGIKKLVCDPESEAEFVIHTHDDMCYNNGELICPLDELEEHEHTDDCYSVTQELICDKEESEGHTHTDECYEQTLGELTCDDTSETHEHDDSCYEQSEELVCGQEESEGHTHDDSCYIENKELVCGFPEVVEHKHDSSCESNGVLACGKAEIVKHQHTDECFETINVVGGAPEELDCGKEEHKHTEECYKNPEEETSSNGGGGGGGGSAAKEETTTVEGATETTTGSAEEATETTTAEHDDLVFAYSDENVSGIITLPWSKELPDDLKCNPVLITEDDSGYGSLLASVDNAAMDKGKRVEALVMYRLEWSVGEDDDTYILPEDLTPTVQFTVLTPTDDDYKLRGFAIKEADTETDESETDEISDEEENERLLKEDEQALNTAISKFSLSTIDDIVVDDVDESDGQIHQIIDPKDLLEQDPVKCRAEDYQKNVDSQISLNAYSVDDIEEVEEEQEYEAEIIPKNSEDSSIDVPLSSVGIFAFAELSETEYSSYGYYKRITDLSDIKSYKQYLVVAQNGLLAMNGSNLGKERRRGINFYTGYTDNSGVSCYFAQTVMKYESRPVEMQRIATSLDPDKNNETEYFRVVDPNDSDNPVTPNSENYSGSFWNFKTYDGTSYAIVPDGTSAEINPDSSNPFSAFTEDNAISFYSEVDGSYTCQVYIENCNSNSWRFYGMNYSYEREQVSGNSTGNSIYDATNLFSNGTDVYQAPNHYTEYAASGNPTYTEFLIYEYIDGNKSSVSDAEAASKVKPSTLGTESVDFVARTKEKCQRFVDVSGAVSIEDTFGSNHIMSGAEIDAKSDPASSQIEYELCMDDDDTDDEALYKEQEKNNGRIVSDKSVIYGDDDYGAFKDGYNSGEFSVALSALGQEWQVVESSDEQTPLDVVFVYDLSGSMRDIAKAGSTITRWEASADAISAAMNDIYKANPNNRVGIVGFSNVGKDILPIGRYSAKDDKIFTYSTYEMTEENGDNGLMTLQLSDDLYDGYTTDSERSLSTYASRKLYGDGMGAATNTQWGLQQAYEMFRDVTDTKVYIPALRKSIDRQPLIVLVTDGDPTFCSYNYMNPKTGPTYGDGRSSGIQGYYTILSANYFKNLTSIHYNRQACFYTIGMGIKDSGYGTFYDDEVTDMTSFDKDMYKEYASYPDHSYMRAVLDPTDENIAALSSYSDTWKKISDEAKSNADPYYTLALWYYYGYSEYAEQYSLWYYYYSYYDFADRTNTYTKNMWEITSKQLKELLTCKNEDGEAIDPGTVVGHTMAENRQSTTKDYAYTVIRDVLGYTDNVVPGVNNPYKDNFNYVDGAYFGELSTEDLEDIFSKIVNKVTVNSRYDFLLKSGTNVVVTDPLGTGMEVKGEPVLRYFGTNYAVTKKSEGKSGSTTYVDYYWEKTADREDSDSRADEPTVDLSSIVARVSTDTTTGDQTVTFTIPEDALPSFYPDLARKFYYEELPARLIYKVGLSDAEEQKLKTEYDETKNVEATYYTNKYGSDGGATVTFEPDKSDPYYENLSGTQTFTKTSNTTETDTYNFSESYNSTTGIVTQKLGNNGVLTLSKDNTVNITVKKQWEEDDTTHPNCVYVGLFGKGTKTDAEGNISDFAKMYGSEVTLQESNNWEYTWSKINRVQVDEDVTYNYDEFYVCEFVPDGYVANYSDGDGNALLEITDTFDITYYKYTKVDSIEALSVEDEDDDSVASSNSIASFNSEVGKTILLADDDGNPVYPPDEEEETSESENAEDVSISPMVAGRYELTKIVEPRPFDVVSAASGTVIITNTSGYNLPYTGGSGKLVTFSAITLLFGALLMYILKRRKEMRS